MPTLLHLSPPPAGVSAAPGVFLGAARIDEADKAARSIDRSAEDAAEQVAVRVRDLALAPAGRLPAATASTLDTWSALAAIGREDLAVGRLVEGHVDALRILREAGREPIPGAVYGVWASASGGTGLTATRTADAWSVDGLMRYCSGAWFVDRALVVVSAEDGKRLADLDVRTAQVPGGSLTRHDDTWPAVGMDVTRSVDIGVRGLPMHSGDLVGGPGFYLDRPGFAAGGVGVAAVWLGGAAGVLDALVGAASGNAPAGVESSAHQRAHLGVMATAIATADALLTELAQRQHLPADDARAARTAVELAVEDVLRRAPRVSGPTPLCRDAAFGHRLADLEVYVRQHHAEAEYELLGSSLLESGQLLGRRFG